MLNIVESEIIWVVFDLFDCGGSYFIYFDWGIEVYILMVEFEFEWGFQIVLVCFVMIKLDLLIVCVFYIVENGG